MAYVAGHLSVAALQERCEACEDATSSRHFQTIWLLAKGHSTGEAAAMTSFGQRWIEQLVERYNALGPSAMGDLRRGNGASAKVLRPELLQRLRVRLTEPPPDGGVWTSGKVARWMANELGLASRAPQRGWEALRAIGWSIQKPRPRNPKAATPVEQEVFKKTRRSRRRRSGSPDNMKFHCSMTLFTRAAGDDKSAFRGRSIVTARAAWTNARWRCLTRERADA